MRELPRGWPVEDGIVFITRNEYTPAAAQVLRPPSRGIGRSGDACSNMVRIKVIVEPQHPAYGQRGLFADCNLQAGQFIIDYFGKVHTAREDDPNSDYDIHLIDDISIDSSRIGNEARFANDWRSIMRRPNAEFATHVVQGELRMALRAIEPIKKGTEICVNYGKSYWEARGEYA